MNWRAQRPYTWLPPPCRQENQRSTQKAPASALAGDHRRRGTAPGRLSRRPGQPVRAGADASGRDGPGRRPPRTQTRGVSSRKCAETVPAGPMDIGVLASSGHPPGHSRGASVRGREADTEASATFTRLWTFTGASDIDSGVAYLRDEVLPVLNPQRGYRGVLASAAQSEGVLGSSRSGTPRPTAKQAQRLSPQRQYPACQAVTGDFAHQHPSAVDARPECGHAAVP
jgi:hypothetical protein